MAPSFKMIRDNMIIKDAEVKICDKARYPQWLARKLIEEATEVFQVTLFHPSVIDQKVRHDRLIEELGDLSEAAGMLSHHYKIPRTVIERERDIKTNIKGGYRLGRLLPIDEKSTERQLCELVQDMLAFMEAVRQDGDWKMAIRAFIDRARKLDALEETS